MGQTVRATKSTLFCKGKRAQAAAYPGGFKQRSLNDCSALGPEAAEVDQLGDAPKGSQRVKQHSRNPAKKKKKIEPPMEKENIGTTTQALKREVHKR